MYDLLEHKDKYQKCNRLVYLAVMIFLCGLLALSWAPRSVEQPRTVIDKAVWQRLLQLLACDDLLPIKMVLTAIEFKRNAIYLSGKVRRDFDEKVLKKDAWHIKKLEKGVIVINKDLKPA